MNAAIQISRLEKSYGGRPVLRGLTFHVKRGEIFALLGVNGAGKTTALECIEGLRRPDAGDITVDGRMGIQLQSASLPAHIRPMEAVRLFAEWNKAAADPSMLKSLGIPGLNKKPYAALSTGQKRRLHLALSLIGDPDVVFLDEPTAGLDVEGRLSLHDQIRELKARGKTIVLASHDMAEVETLCDRLAILHDGAVAFIGTVPELAKKAGARHTIRIRTDLGEEIHQSGDIGVDLPALLEDLKRRGTAVRDIQIDRGTLERYFIDMTRGDGR